MAAVASADFTPPTATHCLARPGSRCAILRLQAEDDLDFRGTQVDQWGKQSDMLFALIGVALA